MNWVVRNWLILAVVVFLLTFLGGVLDGSGRGGAILLIGFAWLAVGIVALVDGFLRLGGQPSLLGSSGRLGRLLAIAQIGLALLLLSNLLSSVL
jgi:hypothetical protein